MKKSKSIHEPFESSYRNGKFYKITDDMVKSKAWSELKLIERGLYFEFKKKYTKYKDGTNNADNISMPKSEYSQLMNERTYYKCVDHLIDLGFIKVIKSGWTTRTCNIYGLSYQWQYYKTDNFKIKESDRRDKRNTNDCKLSCKG